MVIRLLISIFLFLNISNAITLEQAIISFIGEQDYRVNQKFIERVFSQEEKYFDSGKPNLYLISQVLKQNGLLKLSFSSPMELEVAFHVSNNPSAFIVSLYDILQSMGYYYFLVKQSVLDGDKFRFVLSMNTEYAIDPVLLQERLRDYGYFVSDIERRNVSQWIYRIGMYDFNLPKSDFLEINQRHTNASLQGEYWYSVESGNRLSISSSNGILWYPKVVFFDKDLKILAISTTQQSMKSIVVDMPVGTKFIKVSDTYLPIVIKNGLSVILN